MGKFSARLSYGSVQMLGHAASAVHVTVPCKRSDLQKAILTTVEAKRQDCVEKWCAHIDWLMENLRYR